jgi:hypothetical protein
MMRGEQLKSWARHTTPLVKLLDELAACDPVRDVAILSDLATRMARSVLVDPTQSVGDVNLLVDRLSTATAPAARLAVLDLVNALVCVGARIWPELEARTQRGLSELATVGPPLALRMRVGFAAIVCGEFDVAEGMSSEIPELFFGDEEFPNDVLALLGFASVRVGAQGAFDPAWNRVANDLTELCASGQLDESAVLWLARVIYQRCEAQPVGRVAALAHDHLWASRQVKSVKDPEFPLTDTLGGSAYRVEQHLRGRGSQNLWLGRELATGADLLVACDVHNSERQDVAALRRAVNYQLPGIFELAYVGAFDPNDSRTNVDPTDEWAMVEKVTAGSWLPRILGPADPWTAPTKAIELGRSAGRILLRAEAAGIMLARIRPELMWAERRDGHFAVTGLSPRALELYARKVTEMFTYPVFDRFYHAPEIRRDPDDRAVAYSLAVMVAEWATGRYPFASRHAPNGVETGVHEPIAAPRPLARLLEATIRKDRNERPRLVEFVGELEQLTL